MTATSLQPLMQTAHARPEARRKPGFREEVVKVSAAALQTQAPQLPQRRLHIWYKALQAAAEVGSEGAPGLSI